LRKLYYSENHGFNLPEGLTALDYVAVNWFCQDKCIGFGDPDIVVERLGIPASMDLDQLTFVGFSKGNVTILGFSLREPVIESGGNVSLRVSGATGKNIRVDRSTNLVDWEPWKTTTLTNNSAQLMDERRVTGAQFYRVQQF
jgi:hypothetical protein